eukprot:363947-Chlamydomonas_euryale.AAC.5
MHLRRERVACKALIGCIPGVQGCIQGICRVHAGRLLGAYKALHLRASRVHPCIHAVLTCVQAAFVPCMQCMLAVFACMHQLVHE